MPRSAYIHIPFCAHKCDFCDFTAFSGLDHQSKQYCQVVCQEIQLRSANTVEPLQSIFYGGGTPGMLDLEDLGFVHHQMFKAFGFADDIEVTLETTPKEITQEKIAGWTKLGINRLSIGVESLVDSELEAIGRGQQSSDALAAMKTVKASGFANVSCDLMYGLPGQTLSSWSNSLEQVLSFEFPHLSAYGLTISSNTPLAIRYPASSNVYPDEDKFAELYENLSQSCKNYGLNQYEISNFAKDGFESRHNLAYWNNEEYYAFGVGAYRYVDGIRSNNWRSFTRYMNDFGGNESSEKIEPETKRKEAIFLALRTKRGLDLLDFKSRYGFDFIEKYRKKVNLLVEEGFMEFKDDQLRLSQKGILISNSIMSDFM